MLLFRNINHFHKFHLKFSSQLVFAIHNVRYQSFAVESNMEFVLKNISQILSCTEDTALNIYQKFPSIRSVSAISRIKGNTELLINNGVSKELIGDNPFLLILKIDVLQRKLKAIELMQPRHIGDFIPLLNIKEPILKDIATMAAEERDIIPEKSRIYYLSRELQMELSGMYNRVYNKFYNFVKLLGNTHNDGMNITQEIRSIRKLRIYASDLFITIEPVTVSKYCSKYALIFFAQFSGISKKLNILLDYNVDGKQILQSLYVFQCADHVFISRLEDMISKGLYDIKLWIFKCTNEKFCRVLINEIKNEKNTKKAPIELAHKINNRNLEKLTILNELNGMLSCDDKVSAQIYYNFIDNIKQLNLAKQIIEFLKGNGVSVEFIKTNSVVLTLPYTQIKDNIKMIKRMKPNSIEDFLPLVEVDAAKLRTFRYNILETHPIYYFSKKLNISPTVVSKYFAKHSEVFLGDFAVLKETLDLLVAYNVQRISILKSPHTFRLSSKTIEIRLKNLKSQGIVNIASWMLVCDASRLKRFVALQIEERKSIGGSAGTVDYISKRLNWDESGKVKALKIYPPLAKCSVLRVKAHLDYLLNETHFTSEDISSHVSVFGRNLDELKLRLNELHAIGLIPRKLYLLCLDSKRYLEMVGKFFREKNCPIISFKFKSIEKRIKKI